MNMQIPLSLVSDQGLERDRVASKEEEHYASKLSSPQV